MRAWPLPAWSLPSSEANNKKRNESYSNLSVPSSSPREAQGRRKRTRTSLTGPAVVGEAALMSAETEERPFFTIEGSLEGLSSSGIPLVDSFSRDGTSISDLLLKRESRAGVDAVFSKA